MKRLALVLLLASSSSVALADEGMWTFDNFPSATVQKKYNFNPTPQWLEHVRLSSARLAEGCSGSFVSSSGLVMTNHHCAHSCIEQLSGMSKPKHDYVATGFFAKAQADEVKCPALEVNQLTELTDVTAQVNKATAGLSGQAYHEALRKVTSQLENACAAGNTKFRCDVVSLYEGGLYHLYKYHRYQDIRLVFAPEFAIAFFGGDPDNFNFPRYDLDVSFLRAYEDGKPAPTTEHFNWSPAGVKDGDLTFVAGNPGHTSRNLTVAELEYERDVALPERLFALSQLRGELTEFQRRGPEQKRYSNATLFYVENSYKALKGRFGALTDHAFFATKVAAEQELRAKVAADPEMKKLSGESWDAIGSALKQQRDMRFALQYIGQNRGFQSSLFSIAQNIVRAADEIPKDNAVRLEEYADARLPQMKAHLFAPAPIYKDFEILKLTFSLTRMREELGADDPMVRKILGKKSPADLAKELVNGSMLGSDPKGLKLRQQLWDGGKKAVDASTDPMIAFAKLVDADARAIRKKYEDNIESVAKKNHELIGKARFKIYGTSQYPDATFTPRLSYGSVKGFDENGHHINPVTKILGAFDRATGREPFALPATWEKSKASLDQDTPFNFCSDNDIIGGNSGSPVVNQNAEVVGLIFDGNIESLGGDYGFDPVFNRAVAVHSSAVLEALDKIYGAKRLVTEIRAVGK